MVLDLAHRAMDLLAGVIFPPEEAAEKHIDQAAWEALRFPELR